MPDMQDARAGLDAATLNASVCIVGAGAAGIMLARRLAGRVPSVLLIDAGGLELDADTQWLYYGENIGLEYYDLMGCRLRFFGGTTNHWGGYCRPNDPIDFRGRPELGVPAWPVGFDELMPYVDEAALELGLSQDFFDPRPHVRAVGFDPEELLDGPEAGFLTKVFQITRKVRFREIYRDELVTQDNLRIVLNLNVTHVQLRSDGEAVDHLVAQTTTGDRYTIRADRFVLACHGIENARLLLHADDVQPHGIGNRYDHVGRYVMEHPYVIASRLYPSSRFPRFYNRRVMEQSFLNANLSFDDATTERLGILQYYCRFQPIYVEEPVQRTVRRLQTSLMQPADRQFVTDLLDTLRNVDQLLAAAKLFTGWDDLPPYFRLDHRIEQAPNPYSRVVLTDELDDLGMRRADLDWRLNDLDYRTFQVGQEKVVAELSALGLGRFVVEELTPELIESRIAGHYHHIGTTRMSERPEDGVVDAQCRVHGVANLYVAGSSVFPSAGYSGPTMVLMALALRLGDELARHYATAG